MTGLSRTLGFGQFFGRAQERREIPGFSLSRIATLSAPAEIPEHVHETAHIVLVVEGAYVTSAERREPGRPPVLVYNPSGTAHRDTFPSDEGTFFTLSVSDRRLDSLGLRTRLPEQPVALSSGRPVRRARRLMRFCERSARSSARAERLSVDLLVTVADHYGAPQPPSWLATARETLSGQLDDAVSVRDLASRAGVHPMHLIRAFHRFFGETPKEFQRRRRLEHAAVLLETSHRSIVEIALATGFADQSHLTRAFTRAYGVPPAAYRRRSRTRSLVSG